MGALVARTGRHRQRYDGQSRLVAGCIPYRYNKTVDDCDNNSRVTLEVLMVTPHRGRGLLFPKGGWEDDETKEQAACREALEEAGVKGNIEDCLGSWDFISKRHRKDCNIEGHRKGFMFPLAVTDQLESWPEKDARQRKWVTVTEAKVQCEHQWMLKALDKCVDYLSSRGVPNSLKSFDESSSFPFFQSSDEEHSQQCTESSECEGNFICIDVVSDDDRSSSLIEEIPHLTEESSNSSSDE